MRPEAGPARLRAGEHGPERRGVERGEGTPRDRVRRRRREAGALSRAEVNLILHTGATPAAARRRRCSSSSSGAGEGDFGPLSDLDGEIVTSTRPAEAQGARRHLRAPGARRGGLRPSEEDRLSDGEESPDHHQAADPRRAGQPGAAGRSCAGPARREHHGSSARRSTRRRRRRTAASRRSRSPSSRTGRSPSSRRRRPRRC